MFQSLVIHNPIYDPRLDKSEPQVLWQYFGVINSLERTLIQALEGTPAKIAKMISEVRTDPATNPNEGSRLTREHRFEGRSLREGVALACFNALTSQAHGLLLGAPEFDDKVKSWDELVPYLMSKAGDSISQSREIQGPLTTLTLAAKIALAERLRQRQIFIEAAQAISDVIAGEWAELAQ